MNRRLLSGLSAALLAALVGVGPAQAAGFEVPYDSDPDHAWGDTSAPGTVLFDNGDRSGVSNGPTVATVFIIPAGSSYRITSISTYHWNGGAGGTPGTFSIQEDGGPLHGPWDAAVVEGSANRWWFIRPDIVLGPGTYTFLDSVTSTWSYTSGGGHTRILAEVEDSATYQPDGRIRLGWGPFVGNDIHNVTAAGQTRTVTARRGAAVTFTTAIENEGSATDAFTVKAAGSAPGFTVRYLKGTTDITAAILAGTWRTKDLAPGARQSIKIRVTVRTRAAIGSRIARRLVITSVADPTAKDAVKLVVIRR